MQRRRGFSSKWALVGADTGEAGSRQLLVSVIRSFLFLAPLAMFVLALPAKGEAGPLPTAGEKEAADLGQGKEEGRVSPVSVIALSPDVGSAVVRAVKREPAHSPAPELWLLKTGDEIGETSFRVKAVLKDRLVLETADEISRQTYWVYPAVGDQESRFRVLDVRVPAPDSMPHLPRPDRFEESPKNLEALDEGGRFATPSSDRAGELLPASNGERYLPPDGDFEAPAEPPAGSSENAPDAEPSP